MASLVSLLAEEHERYLSKLGNAILKKALSNFDKEKDFEGNKFAELKKPTVRSRRSILGASFDEHPILKRTALVGGGQDSLRNSIYVDIKGNKIFLDSSKSYAQVLNDGRPAYTKNNKGKMSPRPFLDTPKEYAPGTSESLRLERDFQDSFLQRLREVVDEDIQRELDKLI